MEPSEVSIVLCADKNWLPDSRFLISQIDQNNPENLDIWFCATEDLSANLPKHVNFLKVETPAYFGDLPQSDRIFIGKLFAPVLAKSISREIQAANLSR